MIGLLTFGMRLFPTARIAPGWSLPACEEAFVNNRALISTRRLWMSFWIWISRSDLILEFAGLSLVCKTGARERLLRSKKLS